jgi:type IV pilus assembly protein PilM
MLELKNLYARSKNKAKQLPRVGDIGIDIRREGISLAQLQRLPEGALSVRAHASVYSRESDGHLLDSPADLKKLLHKAFKSARFKGRQVVAAMDPQNVKLLPLTYSKSSQGVEATIAKLIGDRVDGDVNDYIIDYLPVRSETREGEQMALVALSQREKVTGYLEVLNQAGLNIVALDIRPAALTRLVQTISFASDNETVLVITFGENNSYLTIISGRRLLFDQQVSFGEKQLLEFFADDLEMDTQQVKELFYRYGLSGKNFNGIEGISNQGQAFSNMLLDIAKPLFMELIDEISRVIVFISSETRGKPISNVYLCGCMSNVDGINRFLSDRLNLPVNSMYGEYRKIFSANEHESVSGAEEMEPGMVIAAGLALRGMV